MKKIKTIDELQRLAKELAQPTVPREETWGGAGVVIIEPKRKNIEYRDSIRVVVTEFAHELSWLFIALMDAFYAEDRLDHCSKIEFFGRLANAASRYLSHSQIPTAHYLCAAVLYEAFTIYDEMENQTFSYLEIAFGNAISNDYIEEAQGTEYAEAKQAIAFFKSQGIEVHNG